MRLAPIILRLRVAKTRFASNIFGAAELDKAMQATLLKQMAFVIPLTERTEKNKVEGAIDQYLVERFGVIVALQNDTSQADKTGLTAYDALHDVRSELFRAILNVWMKDMESPICYVGGSLLDLTGNYLWYQFEFENEARITSDTEGVADIDIGSAGRFENKGADGKPTYTKVRTSEQASFEKMYTNYILSPSPRLPYEGDLKLNDGYPDVLLPDDMAQLFDFSKALHPGGYKGKSFSSAFELKLD